MLNVIHRIIRCINKSDLKDIDNEIDLISHYYNMPDIKKQIHNLSSCQNYFEDKKIGAWGEKNIDQKYEEMAPLATSEALMGLLPYYSDNSVKLIIENALNFLVHTQNADGGWDDLTQEVSIIDATGYAVAVLSQAHINGIIDVQDIIENGVQFLLKHQSSSGGWSGKTGEPGSSKMHYTFCAIIGLVNSINILSEITDDITHSLEKSLSWIKVNSDNHNEEGVGLTSNESLSPVATALAIICFHLVGKKNEIKESWLRFLISSQMNGEWNPESDIELINGQRRVYEFKTIPWAIQALTMHGHQLNLDYIQQPLLRLKEYELPDGGYVKDIGDNSYIIWFTSMVLIMSNIIEVEIKRNHYTYLNHIKNDVFKNLEKIKKLVSDKKLEDNLITFYFIFLYINYATLTYTHQSIVAGLVGDPLGKILLFIGFGVIIVPFINWFYKRGKLTDYFQIIITVFAIGTYIFILQ